MKNLNNLHMTASPHSAMVGVGWDADNGDRLHVWLQVENNPATGRSEPVSPYRVKVDRPFGHKAAKAILYRNCALKLSRGGPGYFDTRYLGANAATNSALVAEALRQAEAGGMYEAALLAHETAEEERERAQREERVAKVRAGLVERRERLATTDRVSALAMIDGLLKAPDEDLLELCWL
jgi:hypothetical protein